MSLPVLMTPTALGSTVTATAATLATALDGTRPPGMAIYALVSNTDSWIAQGIADTVFTASSTTNILTATAHKLGNGMPVQLTAGTTLPTGLSTSTTYWAFVINANTFYLYDTRAHALAGGSTGRKTFSDNGSGTLTAVTIAVKQAAGSSFLPSGSLIAIDGLNGAKLSIVRDSADGFASLTQCLMGR